MGFFYATCFNVWAIKSPSFWHKVVPVIFTSQKSKEIFATLLSWKFFYFNAIIDFESENYKLRITPFSFNCCIGFENQNNSKSSKFSSNWFFNCCAVIFLGFAVEFSAKIFRSHSAFSFSNSNFTILVRRWKISLVNSNVPTLVLLVKFSVWGFLSKKTNFEFALNTKFSSSKRQSWI